MNVNADMLFGTRRKLALLRSMFGAEGSLTAQELSLRSRVSLPQTGRILREFVSGGAVRVFDAYPTAVYSIEKDSRDILRPIFAREGLRPDETSRAAIAVMVEHGAPLMVSHENMEHSMSPEMAFAQAVRLARQDASLLSALPVVVANFSREYRRSAFWMSLRDEARKLGMERHTGMLLALFSTLLKDRPLLATSRLFKGTKCRRKNHVPFRGWYQSSWERMLAERNTPAVAREWGFLMNTSESDFAHHLGAQ